jgi:uncharacterized protein (DUF433 family)
VAGDVELLEREMYSEAEAARLLKVAPSTLHYWLEGGIRRGVTYAPVIRTEPTGVRMVLWAEFIEAGLLREYRRTHRVPMVELRAFIDGLRQLFGVPYPLAHERPLVSGRKLVQQAQTAADLDPEFCLVAVANNQLLLTGPGESFLQRVRWADDIATGWRPHADPESPVVIDPDVRFGRPSVSGISTEVLWEHAEAGAEPKEIAEVFQLPVHEVRWAIAYESTSRAA